MLDTADIVRDGDITPIDEIAYLLDPQITSDLPTIREPGSVTDHKGVYRY